MSTDRQFLRQVLKCAATIVFLAIACKYTKGFAAVLIVLAGITWSFNEKPGKALCCYVILPFLVIFNPNLLSVALPLIASSRFGILLIGVAMIMAATKRTGRFGIPLFSLAAYLCVECVSSINGYCPNVSFMKLGNFTLFMVGIALGTKNIDKRPKEVLFVRAFMMAMCCVMIFGSLLMLFFPAYAYATSTQYYVQQYGAAVAAQMLKERGTESALFSGLTNHSQSMAPIAALMMIYVLADMFFIRKKADALHVLLLIGSFVCVYLTRSRTGLLSMSVGIFMICVYAAKKIRLPIIVRGNIRKIVGGFLFCIVVLAIGSEVSNQSITKWLRKGDKVESGHSLGEALTSTRMGAIEEGISDFKRSPIWGNGFQVNADSARFKGQFVLFAPVEKGLLPMVIVGEGGTLGVVAFLFFLISFVSGCIKMRMYITLATFTTFLATNIGEATFFSPGGTGGILWILGSVGGLVLDACLRSDPQPAVAYRKYPQIPYQTRRW